MDLRETDPADTAAAALPGEQQVLIAARRSLAGQTKGPRSLVPFLGPAFVAAVAYVDPGNFATNVAGGAQYGYLLLWVVLVANVMAMLIQTMSAKLGIATGRNLPELCRERFPRPVVVFLWIQAEVIAMATDMAEFVGAAIGLNLIFGVPLFPAGLITALIAFAVLALQARGFRDLELVVAGLVGVIVIAFSAEVVIARPSVADALAAIVTPRFADRESIVLAAGILGATVMPHVIYLHSALTQKRIVGRDDTERRKIFAFERWDVIIAMSIAGAINMSMLAIAAAVFHAQGIEIKGDLNEAHAGLSEHLGSVAGWLFGIGLLASGLASASVGTMAGQVVMQGFIRRRIPLFLRRALTMLPALVILGLGINASFALVLSQVVLSFGIPFALVPLVLFCADRSLMGVLVNARLTSAVAAVVALAIIVLNAFLLYRIAVPT